MPMNPRLLRPRRTIHPEAADWANRVRTNGGSVSGTTLSAVSKFCVAIQQANIRDRFIRANLFCGTGLSACLVPLYRGPSLSGTQYGNTTDTNNGPFVSTDYAETGASGGLTGNGSSKYLLCGSVLSAVFRESSHMMAYGSSLTSPVAADRLLLGAQGASAAGLVAIQTRDGASVSLTRYFSGNNASNPADGTAAGSGFADGCIVGSAVSSTDARVFRNGSQIGSTVTANRGTGAQTSVSCAVFAFSNNGSILGYQSARLCGYSIGLGMTPQQVSSYYVAIQAFQTALGRNI